MAEITVNVVREGDELRLDPQDFPLNNRDDWVRWKFPEDLAPEEFGMIFFQPRLGPFYSLRSYSNKEVLGKGNAGVANTYSYTAMILQPGRSGDQPGSVPIGTGTIDNKVTEPNTTPDITVTYDPGGLRVSPDPVGLNPGDTATWHFNLQAGTFADLWFIEMNSVSGPFAAFYTCKSDNLAQVRASGTNFAYGDLALIKRFTYYVEIRDAQGKLLARDEPGIDNLGPPPG